MSGKTDNAYYNFGGCVSMSGNIDEKTFFEKWKVACKGNKEKDLVANWSDKNIFSYIILGEKGLKKKKLKNIEREINVLYDRQSVVELIKNSFNGTLELHQEYYASDVILFRLR